MYLLECMLGSFDFAETSLIRLIKKAIHIGQLDFVIVEQNQLK